MRFRLVFLLFALAISGNVWAQRKCATDEVAHLNKTDQEILLEREYFENWISEKKLSKRSTNATQGLDEITVYQIPIVVHIIHRGEPEGVGYNIPEEQILAQVQVLNEDFRHLNADSINTPPVFRPLMADIGFEFVLAKQDPAGFKTDGITRTDGNKSSWFFSENEELKSLSYWNSEDYLNVWVAPLSGYLGWAEFPTSDIIDGINEFAEDNPLTDGVVIETTTFGSKTLYPDGDYNDDYFLGRTLTHEIGHFFGLRHIWGDGDCSEDDYVDDTPNTSSSYSGCPVIGTTTYSCEDEPSMFMNYMDYVYDDCMNLFTSGQKDRMEVIINNSPRRASLLTSPGLLPPPPLDIGVTVINSPAQSICGESFTPEIEVVNNGTAMIMELQMAFKVNQVTIEEKTFNLNLVEDDIITLSFSDFTLPTFGTHEILFEVLATNNGPDDNPLNNIASIQVYYSETVTSLNEEFTSWPSSWAVRTDAPISKWNISKAPNTTITNTSAVLNYYENNSTFSDQLITPTLSLSGLNNPSLLFDYAYANNGSRDDTLMVVVSTDCGLNFSDTIYLNSGEELSKNTPHPTQYTPAGPADWRTIALDLTNYSNQSIQVGFVGKSDGGNNIYLDNIFLVDAQYTDLSIKGLLNESAAYFGNQNPIQLLIDNTGNATINDFQIAVKSGSETLEVESFSGMALDPMERIVIDLPLELAVGLSTLDFEIILTDNNPDNNYFSSQVNSLSTVTTLPFRETFSKETWNANNAWTITSPGDQAGWEYTGEYLKLKAFGIGNKGLHDWLVLPSLDFSTSSEAGLRFKYAYPRNGYNDELLRIWASTNNGQSFDHLVKTLPGQILQTGVSDYEWEPTSDEDWGVEFIDLSEFAGLDHVLIGFEGTDGDGNNLYLDDIELYISADPDVVELSLDNMAAYPNPITNLGAQITFSLTNKQDITVRIIDAMGNLISNQFFPDVLNQTYPLEMTTHRNGIYFIQAIGPEFNSTTKVIVNR